MSASLRRARPGDADTVADIFAAARHAALPQVRWAHSEPEIREWVTEVMLPRGGVWLAEQEGQAAGFTDVAEGWVNQLYLRPPFWRRGIGADLLAHAKTLQPAGLQLWCFQCNTPARAFYEANGFTALRQTDGDNEEHEPDVLYGWAGDPARA